MGVTIQYSFSRACEAPWALRSPRPPSEQLRMGIRIAKRYVRSFACSKVDTACMCVYYLIIACLFGESSRSDAYLSALVMKESRCMKKVAEPPMQRAVFVR